MTRRKILIGIVLMLVLVIGFGSVIKFNRNLNTGNYSTISTHPTANPAKEQDHTNKKVESHDELEDAIEDAMIQVQYPNELPYPGVNQFNVFVSFYPNDAIYCDISADIGKTSERKIDLKKEKIITYYLPDNFDGYMLDVITFKFYDEYSRFIKEYKIYVLYDEDSKRIQMIEGVKKI